MTVGCGCHSSAQQWAIAILSALGGLLANATSPRRAITVAGPLILTSPLPLPRRPGPGVDQDDEVPLHAVGFVLGKPRERQPARRHRFGPLRRRPVPTAGSCEHRLVRGHDRGIQVLDERPDGVAVTAEQPQERLRAVVPQRSRQRVVQPDGPGSLVVGLPSPEVGDRGCQRARVLLDRGRRAAGVWERLRQGVGSAAGRS
ncbi:hypothetical protein C6W10_11810 [Plantactinospora sp. BB1]|nr:hypothetical protein C6W10_11810 [Plantactinospora sp. BB1]